MRCQPLLTPALLSSVTSECKRFDEAVRYEELIAGRGEGGRGMEEDGRDEGMGVTCGCTGMAINTFNVWTLLNAFGSTQYHTIRCKEKHDPYSPDSPRLVGRM